jgi:hypothetical protein
MPTLIGTFVVQRTSDIAELISITPIAGMPWGTYIANSTGDGTPTSHSAADFLGGTILIAVPEPSTMILAVVAALPLLCLRRKRRAHSE